MIFFNFKNAIAAICLLCAALIASQANGQVIYGVGVNAGATYNQVFSINPTSGAATRVCNTVTLAATSVAMGVSNRDGLTYHIAQGAAPPNIRSFNPSTCVEGPANPTTLPANILRATACPDGRFYVMSNGGQFFEINPATGVTVRTLNWAGLPAGGSGDFTCASNGTLYVIAQDGVANYNLYSVPSASFSTVPSGSTVTATNLGDVGIAGAPNGLSEAPSGGVGCVAAPGVCLVASSGTASNNLWGLNTTSGAATVRGPLGQVLTDLSRNFPVNVTTVKNVTPTIALQGRTLTYTINVSNPGPGVVGSVNVTDNFTPGAYSSVNWVCGVIAAGNATLVTTACAAPSGTGNINQTASLSINGQVRYTITAVLSNAFTGTLTNVGSATVSVNFFDPTPTNNVSTVTATVVPAAALSVSKSDGITTTFGGNTITYTVTFANGGPGAANGAVIQDTPGAGLSSCTVLSCTPAGGAVCPATPALILAPSTTTLPTFPAGSTATFLIRCRVSATGL